MIGLVLVALAAGVLVGCAVDTNGIEPGKEYRLAVDPRFTLAELVELRAAVARWFDASGGRMNVRLVSHGEDAHGYVHRGTSDVAYRRRTLEIWIDPDALADAGPEAVRRLAMHYEGRLFGLAVVTGQRAIMNPDDVADELVAADIASCIGAGLCGGAS